MTAPLDPSRSLEELIRSAESVLSGAAAPDNEIDPRWQLIIAIGDHIPNDPQSVWGFVARWGRCSDADIRVAVATCLLEHLLEQHFDLVFPGVCELARADSLFADTLRRCWKFGQATWPENAWKLDALVAELNRAE